MAIAFNKSTPDYFISSEGISLPNADWCIALAVRITSNEGTGRQALFSCFDGVNSEVTTKQLWVRVHEASFSSNPGKCLTRVCDGVNPEIILTSSLQLTVGAWVLGVFQRKGSSKELWVGSFGSIPTLQASSTAALGAFSIASTYPFNIARQPGNNTYGLQGDLAFFARGEFALTTDQMLALSRGTHPLKVTSQWVEYLPLTSPAATMRPVIGTQTYTRSGSPAMVASPFPS